MKKLEHESIETKFFEELDKFETILKELTTTSSSGTSTIQNIIEQPKLTLPTITLPKFAGDISEWRAFWDKFSRYIHKGKNIAKINKLSYLLGQLKANAYLVVSQLAITEDK